MFVLKIVTDFASAHSLRDYPGDCARLHGHNWQVEVSVCSQALDDSGIAIDFREIKSQTKVVVKRLDHQYLNEISLLMFLTQLRKILLNIYLKRLVY